MRRLLAAAPSGGGASDPSQADSGFWGIKVQQLIRIWLVLDLQLEQLCCPRTQVGVSSPFPLISASLGPGPRPRPRRVGAALIRLRLITAQRCWNADVALSPLRLWETGGWPPNPTPALLEGREGLG